MCTGYQWLDYLAQPLSDCNSIVEYRPLECHPLLELLAALLTVHHDLFCTDWEQAHWFGNYQVMWCWTRCISTKIVGTKLYILLLNVKGVFLLSKIGMTVHDVLFLSRNLASTQIVFCKTNCVPRAFCRDPENGIRKEAPILTLLKPFKILRPVST